MPNLDTFLDSLAQAATPEELVASITGLRDTYALDHVICHRVAADGRYHDISTSSDIWKKRYAARDYIHSDPVIVENLHNFMPVDWKQLDWSSQSARVYRDDAIAHGIGTQGFTIPLHGPDEQITLLSLSQTIDDRNWADFTQRHQSDWILIAHYLQQKIMGLGPQGAPKPTRVLSPRETDALTYLGMGYSRCQVADLLEISEHTLRAYIENARFKLGGLNTTHAVARAVSDGLITVSGTAAQNDNREIIRSVAR